MKQERKPNKQTHTHTHTQTDDFDDGKKKKKKATHRQSGGQPHVKTRGHPPPHPPCVRIVSGFHTQTHREPWRSPVGSAPHNPKEGDGGASNEREKKKKKKKKKKTTPSTYRNIKFDEHLQCMSNKQIMMNDFRAFVDRKKKKKDHEQHRYMHDKQISQTLCCVRDCVIDIGRPHSRV
jgi:hypothetical protein